MATDRREWLEFDPLLPHPRVNPMVVYTKRFRGKTQLSKISRSP